MNVPVGKSNRCNSATPSANTSLLSGCVADGGATVGPSSSTGSFPFPTTVFFIFSLVVFGNSVAASGVGGIVGLLLTGLDTGLASGIGSSA
jgi:hypothetical protein